jgi:hypothetical protein
LTALTLVTLVSVLPGECALEPTVIAERYYSSGRSERHQKTSPTLPYGAPIPDNYGPSTTSGSSSTSSGTTGSTSTGAGIITPSSTTEQGSGTTGGATKEQGSGDAKDKGTGTPDAGSKDKTDTKGQPTSQKSRKGFSGRGDRYGTSLGLPEEIGRVEGPRDMNIFQLEPTVVHERFYTSGNAERHQNISTTLPLGAPIPDRYTDAELIKEGVQPMNVQTIKSTP